MTFQRAPLLGILERWRFAFLLACLLGMFLLQPMLSARAGGEARAGADVALVAVLVACLASLRRRGWVLVAGLLLIGGALAAFGIARAAPSRPATGFALVAALLAMSFTVGSLLWHVIREQVVRAETILGGICVYFLLSCVWAMIYSLIELLQPGSLAPAAGRLVGPQEAGTLLAPDLLYYSLFVLTTIGPQDIEPVSRTARAWTGVEALAGQLFLVVFISRMVGLHAADRGGGARDGGPRGAE